MGKLKYAVPYAALGLVLVAAIGGFAISTSADPSAIKSTNDPDRSGYEREIGLRPLVDGAGDELRIWIEYHDFHNGQEAWAIIVTPTEINRYGAFQDTWRNFLPWENPRRIKTPVAAEVLALMPALRDLEDGSWLVCAFDHPTESVEGVYDGKRFSRGPGYGDGECGGKSALEPAVVKRLFELLNGVPKLIPDA